MNILDIICVLIIAYMILRGLYRGILIEVFSLVGLVVGFVLAKRYYILAAPFIERGINAPGWAAIISFMLIFLLVIFAFTLVAKALKGILTLTFVGWSDLLVGGILGLIKGVLISCVILALIINFMPDAGFLQQSMMAPWLSDVTDLLRRFIPVQVV